jgi:alkylation response protein AidB-like acyl-CoA dehydrogenase
MFVAVETARSVSYYAGCVAGVAMKQILSSPRASRQMSPSLDAAVSAVEDPANAPAGSPPFTNGAALALAASMAKAACSEAFFRCASDTIQVHGGIGFTWEHDAHLFFKRARATEAMLGDGAYHREAIAREIGL